MIKSETLGEDGGKAAKGPLEPDSAGMDRLLSNIFKAASGFAITATDPKGLITAFNRGAELMLGYSAEEMVGKKTPLAFHLEAEVKERERELSAEEGHPVQGFEVMVTQCRREGSETREWTYVRKGGSLLPVSLVITPMYSESGECIGYLGIATDISHRKNIQHEVNRLAAIVRHSTELINLADLSGKMVFLNEAGSELLGIDPEKAGEYGIM